MQRESWYILFGLFVYGYLANFEMNAKCRSEYEVILPEAACKEPVRLVFLTDLHGWIYGKENEKLLRQVAQGKTGSHLYRRRHDSKGRRGMQVRSFFM